MRLPHLPSSTATADPGGSIATAAEIGPCLAPVVACGGTPARAAAAIPADAARLGRGWRCSCGWRLAAKGGGFRFGRLCVVSRDVHAVGWGCAVQHPVKRRPQRQGRPKVLSDGYVGLDGRSLTVTYAMFRRLSIVLCVCGRGGPQHHGQPEDRQRVGSVILAYIPIRPLSSCSTHRGRRDKLSSQTASMQLARRLPLLPAVTNPAGHASV